VGLLYLISRFSSTGTRIEACFVCGESEALLSVYLSLASVQHTSPDPLLATLWWSVPPGKTTLDVAWMN